MHADAQDPPPVCCSSIQLTQAASDSIADFYTELRSAHGDDRDALPVTVRTLETIVRLSTAVGKSRLATGAHQGHACW